MILKIGPVLVLRYDYHWVVLVLLVVKFSTERLPFEFKRTVHRKEKMQYLKDTYILSNKLDLTWQIIWHQYLELKKTKSTAHFTSKLVLVDMETDAQEFTINQLLVRQLCYKISTSTHRTRQNLPMDRI